MTTITSTMAVLSPILLAVLAAVSWLYKHEKERRSAVERQLSEHKYKAYMSLINIFFDAFKATKGGHNIDQTKVSDQMIEVNKDLLIYGSDEVLLTWLDCVETARRAGAADFRKWARVVVAIRQDMGNAKTRLTGDHVIRMLVTDYEEAKVKGLF